VLRYKKIILKLKKIKKKKRKKKKRKKEVLALGVTPPLPWTKTLQFFFCSATLLATMGVAGHPHGATPGHPTLMVAKPPSSFYYYLFIY
jgi:hypothetical protein